MMLIGIVTGTPVWVWAVLAYGIYMGIRALGRRQVSLWTLGIVPLVFLGISLPQVAAVALTQPLAPVFYGLCAAAGAVVGWFFLTPEPLAVDRSRGTLVISGTWTVLVVFLTVFAVKFTYGTVLVVAPATAAQPGFVSTVFGLSGLATGIVVGRTARLYTEFFQTFSVGAE
jgi:hypothetical protein